MLNAPIIDLDDYKILKKIGKGGFGQLYLVAHKEKNENDNSIVEKSFDTNNLYAAKVSHQKLDDVKEFFYQELMTYSKSDNPAILNFIGYSLNNFKNKPFPTIILEYMPNGSLEKILKKSRKSALNILSNSKKFIIILGIALGMKYLHSIGIIHRDLKPGNVLLDENFFPKICDFGISFVSDLSLSKILMDDPFGTPSYMAPEIIKDDFYTYKVDVYSFALLMYELLSEQIIFENYSNKRELFKDIEDGKRPDLSYIMCNKMKNLIKKCWDGDPSKRPSFNEIVNELFELRYDKYFDANQDEIDSYLQIFDKNLMNANSFMALNVRYAAEHGDIKAMKYYAYMNYFGKGIHTNKKEAAHFFKILAHMGDVNSMNNYGKMLFHGDGVEKNKKEALKYFKMSADNGNSIGMFEYAYSHDIGEGTPIDKITAAKYYKLSAKRGYSDAMNNYGNMLKNGDGIQIDLKKAAKYFKLSAEKGNKIGMLNYACCLKNGIGIEVDKKKAAKFFKKSAEKGENNSMIYYAKMLSEGDGIEKNMKEAIKYFKISINNGNSVAMIQYGLILYYGNEVSVNKKKAAFFFKMAANKGNIEGMILYANMLFDGDGINVDKKNSAFYYKMAADKGHINAMINYAKILYKGDGIEENQKEAAEYFKKAADLGNSYAMNKYGIMLYDGYKIKKKNKKSKNKIFSNNSQEINNGYRLYINKKEAAKYWKKAADLYNIESMLFYGKMLLLGEGIPENKIEGYKYIKMSADFGNDIAMLIMSYVLYMTKYFIEYAKNEAMTMFSIKQVSSLMIKYFALFIDRNNIRINKEMVARFRNNLNNKNFFDVIEIFEKSF